MGDQLRNAPLVEVPEVETQCCDGTLSNNAALKGAFLPMRPTDSGCSGW
jgi:hypothetical protein